MFLILSRLHAGVWQMFVTDSFRSQMAHTAIFWTRVPQRGWTAHPRGSLYEPTSRPMLKEVASTFVPGAGPSAKGPCFSGLLRAFGARGKNAWEAPAAR